MRPIAAAALLALAWPAAAQAAVLGGGTAPAGLRGYQSRLTIVSLRPAGSGTAIVRALVQARCGAGKIKRTVDLAADGSFSLAATARDRAPEQRGVRRVASVALTGRIQGTAATGTASARVRLLRHGHTVARCKSGVRSWQVRAAAPEPAIAPARPKSPYYGLTGQPGRPRALLLRVGVGRIQAAVFEYRLSCRRRAVERANVTPGGPISPTGAFNLRERFTLRYADATERFRVKVDGRFTTAGVKGALSVTSVARSGGAVIDTCTTGRVPFAGAL